MSCQSLYFNVIKAALSWALITQALEIKAIISSISHCMNDPSCLTLTLYILIDSVNAIEVGNKHCLLVGVVGNGVGGFLLAPLKWAINMDFLGCVPRTLASGHHGTSGRFVDCFVLWMNCNRFILYQYTNTLMSETGNGNCIKIRLLPHESISFKNWSFGWNQEAGYI